MCFRSLMACAMSFSIVWLPASSADALENAMPAPQETSEGDRFEPVREAPLPEGFAEPTPVDEIRVKEYPAYRLARAPMQDGENRAFWTLFQHISANDIPMTAPVEVTYRQTANDRWTRDAMAFLYQFPEQNAERGGPAVEIVDVPATTAVSLGVRGEMSPTDLEQARDRLDQWLRANQDSYLAAGPLRVMGYNSPFVPAANRYFEVEIPIRNVR